MYNLEKSNPNFQGDHYSVCFLFLQRYYIWNLSRSCINNGGFPFLPTLPQGSFATEYQSQVFDARSMVCSYFTFFYFLLYKSIFLVLSSNLTVVPAVQPDISFCDSVRTPNPTRKEPDSAFRFKLSILPAPFISTAFHLLWWFLCRSETLKSSFFFFCSILYV